jgi:nucleoside-diphosphate-sugar epimerase
VPCPISSYGLEKLYAEKLYLAFARKYGFIAKIARFDTIYGLYDRYNDIRAKVIPSLCYKIYKTESNKIEIWGNGKQERAYLYIDDCIRAISLFMHNDGFSGPINICSENTMTVTQLAKKIMKIAEKPVSIVYNTDKPSGVQYRVSCNDELKCSFEWNEDVDYDIGILHVYKWIKSQC